MNNNRIDYENKSTKEDDFREAFNEVFIHNIKDEESENNSDEELRKPYYLIFKNKSNESFHESSNINIIINENNEEFKNENYTEKSMLSKKRNNDNSINNFSKINSVKKNEIKEKEIIFNIIKNRKITYRLDYYIKSIKESILTYLLNYGRNLIKNCNFGDNIRKYKFHMPNYKLYQGNPKEKDNREFLKKTIIEVFLDYNKNNDEGKRNQLFNKILIEKIYQKKDFPFSKEEQNLKNFFEMTIEEGIKMYYNNSFEFQEFKKNRTIKFYDRKFYIEKNRKFSLLERNGFIKLVNMPFYSKNQK